MAIPDFPISQADLDYFESFKLFPSIQVRVKNLQETAMTLIQQTATEIARYAPSSGFLKILQELEIGKEGWQNELVLFMKPELQMVSDPAYIRQSALFILNKLAEYQAEVHGIAIVGGQFLANNGIMDRHYGYINHLSKQASRVLQADDLAKIAAAFDLPSLAGIPLYGGHEYLNSHPEETVTHLDAFWFSKKAIKIRSGFYIQQYEKNGAPFILVNGFHPSQLLHFTTPDRRIVLFLVHSSTPWKTLRNDMVGNTFPEKAAPSSIRGSFFADPAGFGLSKVDISQNGAHLSAGPFEGVFEVLNFFGSLYERADQKPMPLLIRRLVARGLTAETALKVRANPAVTVDEKNTDLFSATVRRDLPLGKLPGFASIRQPETAVF
jgi:hypothetical protein